MACMRYVHEAYIILCQYQMVIAELVVLVFLCL